MGKPEDDDKGVAKSFTTKFDSETIVKEIKESSTLVFYVNGREVNHSMHLLINWI